MSYRRQIGAGDYDSELLEQVYQLATNTEGVEAFRGAINDRYLDTSTTCSL